MCHVFYDILWRRDFVAASPRGKSGSAMKKRIEKKKMQKVNEIADSCDQWGSALRYSNLRDKLASDGFTEMIGSFMFFPCFSGRLWKDKFSTDHCKWKARILKSYECEAWTCCATDSSSLHRHSSFIKCLLLCNFLVSSLLLSFGPCCRLVFF